MLQRDGEAWIFCLSEERQAKDQTIREKHQSKLLRSDR